MMPEKSGHHGTVYSMARYFLLPN